MSPTRTTSTTLATLVLAAFLILGAVGAAAAAPGTLRALDLSSPALTGVTVTTPGGSFTGEPGRALIRITPSGGSAAVVSGWCVDPDHFMNENTDYQVDLQTPADTPALDTARYREAAWLMGEADGLIAVAPDPSLEAAAVQVAVWQLTGGAADITAVTDRPDLNSRVSALRALAAGRRPVTALAMSAAGGAVTTGSPATLNLTGTPGAVVDLAVTAGSATLSGTQVTLDANGVAQVTVTPAAPGDVTVQATAQGGALQRAARLPGRTAPQEMAVVTPVTLSATATVTATAPTVVPPVVITAVPAKLRLVKTAPGRVRRGATIAYRLTVTNTGTVAARNVVVRDPIPAGTYVKVLPSRARLSGGVVVWRLGTIAPGRKVTVALTLRTRVTAVRDVVNIATAAAANAAKVSARTRTKLVLPTRVKPARVQPAVTG